jgi:hypothetical protein
MDETVSNVLAAARLLIRSIVDDSASGLTSRATLRKCGELQIELSRFEARAAAQPPNESGRVPPCSPLQSEAAEGNAT